MTKRISRRRFLKAGAGVALGGTFLIRSAAGYSANEKVNIGVVGIAGQGHWNLEQLEKCGANIAALCDVHEGRDQVLANRERLKHAAFYTDFRKLVEHKGLDAVLIATTDHTHAPATIAALKNDLHVYCEKPLTHTVEEARRVAELAAEKKRVTQMGTQIHAGNNYRRVVELVQSGTVGAVKEVHVWVGKNWGGGKTPKKREEIPKGLDWDLWLGPAAERAYHSCYLPREWRRWWDFGGGTLNDMACHHMDLSFWALDLRHPEKVAAESETPPNAETACEALTVHYEFPARGKLPAVKLTWYDGGKRPALFKDADAGLPQWGDGTLFVGDKGMLIADYDKYKLLPEDKFKDFTPPKPTIPNSIGHHKEWIEAIKTGGATTCNFDYAGALTEAVLLGNVAYRVGKPLTWDAKNLKAVNEPNADKLIRKAYRKGWKLG